jgi:hypothetical protein
MNVGSGVGVAPSSDGLAAESGLAYVYRTVNHNLCSQAIVSGRLVICYFSLAAFMHPCVFSLYAARFEYFRHPTL